MKGAVCMGSSQVKLSQVKVCIFRPHRNTSEHLNRTLDKRSFVIVADSEQANVVLIEAQCATDSNLKRLKNRVRTGKVVIIDVAARHTRNIPKWIRWGVAGFIMTGGTSRQYADAIRAAAGRLGASGGAVDGSALTAKEQQIVRLVIDGKTNKEIANLLGNSDRTIGTHLGRIFNKWGCRKRSQLAAMAAIAVQHG
jgi:DNA-binding NarL/FixJ family response regulator